MKNLKKIFSVDQNRFLSKGFLITITLIIIVLSMYSLYQFNTYQKTIDNVKNFKKLEKFYYKIIKQAKKYLVYELVGVRSFFVPSQAVVLFKSASPTEEMRARFDLFARLDINYTAKGVHAISYKFPYSAHFSSILLLFGTLAGLCLGIDAFKDKNLIRLLSSANGSGALSLYTQIFLSRLAVLGEYFLYFWGLFLGIMFLGGYKIPANAVNEVVMFALTSWLTILIFFIAGSIIGMLFAVRFARVISALIFYISSILIIPMAVFSVITGLSDSITSDFEVELRQLRVFIEFESKMLKRHGPFNENKRKKSKDLADEFYLNEYPKIEAIENELRAQVENSNRLLKNIAVWYPTTFCLLTIDEVSSKGANSYSEYYKRLQELKKAFLKFRNERVFENDPSEIVSFIKKDENIFHAQPSLPKNWLLGLIINSCYCLILLAVSYFLFKRSLFTPPIKGRKYYNLDDDFKKKGRYKIYLYEDDLVSQFFNAFSGKLDRLDGKLSLNGENLIGGSRRKFVYVPGPENFPKNLKVKHLYDFLKDALDIPKIYAGKLRRDLEEDVLEKRFGSLPIEQRAIIIARIFSKIQPEAFIFADFMKGIPFNHHQKVIDKMESMFMNKESAIIDISTIKTCATKPKEFINILLKDNVYHVTRN